MSNMIEVGRLVCTLGGLIPAIWGEPKVRLVWAEAKIPRQICTLGRAVWSASGSLGRAAKGTPHRFQGPFFKIIFASSNPMFGPPAAAGIAQPRAAGGRLFSE